MMVELEEKIRFVHSSRIWHPRAWELKQKMWLMVYCFFGTALYSRMWIYQDIKNIRQTILIINHKCSFPPQVHTAMNALLLSNHATVTLVHRGCLAFSEIIKESSSSTQVICGKRFHNFSPIGWFCFQRQSHSRVFREISYQSMTLRLHWYFPSLCWD